MNNFNMEDGENLNKLKLIKLFFKNIVEDGKIDSDEKSIFSKLKERFELSDSICSKLLAEALNEKKKNEANNNCFFNLTAGTGNQREYKKALYANVLLAMLENGVITEEENELLVIFEKIIELTEDIEYEARTEVHSEILRRCIELINSKEFDRALILLTSFKPDLQNLEKYYKAAFEYIKNIFKIGIKTGEAHVEYEKLFLHEEKQNPPAQKFTFTPNYYYCKLINGKTNFSLKETELKKLLEKAETAEQKFLVLFELGFLCHTANKIDCAANYYKKAFEFNSNDADLIINLTSCLLSQKKYDDAYSLANNALITKNDNPMLLNNAAIVNSKLKKFNDAKELFEKALTIDNNFYDARLNLILALIEQKNFEKAQSHVTILDRQIPSDPLLCKIKATLRNFHK